MNLAGEFFTEINDDKCPPGLNIYYIKFATVGNRGGGGDNYNLNFIRQFLSLPDKY